jgi:hypothetical protein
MSTNEQREGWLRRHRALVTGVVVGVLAVIPTLGWWDARREAQKQAAEVRRLEENERKAEVARRQDEEATEALKFVEKHLTQPLYPPDAKDD